MVAHMVNQQCAGNIIHCDAGCKPCCTRQDQTIISSAPCQGKFGNNL